MRRILVIQTAFAGDLILATPLMTEARRLLDPCEVDVLCIPSTAPLLAGHPDVASIIPYDKRGGESVISMHRALRRGRYDVVLSPHRSLRSALLSRATRAPVRVTFDRSAASRLSSVRVPYRGSAHEVERNLDLLAAIADGVDYACAPRLAPPETDRRTARNIAARMFGSAPFICMAPGSVWATKRWIPEGFAKVARILADDIGVLLVGGPDDRALCEGIQAAAGVPGVVSVAGTLTLLESAALIGLASLVISNDSAPVHLASAMGTPVVEIFGATSPSFGFTPFGVPHAIVQMDGLSCRPCAIHGGDACPIRTFACMRTLAPEVVITAARRLLSGTGDRT